MRRDADGFYYFVGRADDMFVCGGENIYPGEVETMLERHPGHPAGVRGAGGRRDQGRQAGRLRRAGRPATAPSAEAVKEWALAHGPAYQHPRHVEFVAELPLAGTGKIDRKALTARGARARAERATA